MFLTHVTSLVQNKIRNPFESFSTLITFMFLTGRSSAPVAQGMNDDKILFYLHILGILHHAKIVAYRKHIIMFEVCVTFAICVHSLCYLSSFKMPQSSVIFMTFTEPLTYRDIFKIV